MTKEEKNKLMDVVIKKICDILMNFCQEIGEEYFDAFGVFFKVGEVFQCFGRGEKEELYINILYEMVGELGLRDRINLDEILKDIVTEDSMKRLRQSNDNSMIGG